MSRRPKTRFWRIARRGFRWCRIAALLVILALLVSAIWLNRVGVPEFLKHKLVTELKTYGVDLQFSRMRLHPYRGLLVDDVRVGRPADTNAPQISAVEAELLIDGKALLRRNLELVGVALRGGTVVLPVWGTNAVPREVTMQNVSGEVRFTRPDTWELVGFRGQTFGVNVILAGSVTNATAIRQMKLKRSTPPKEKSAEAFWYSFISKLEASEFEEPAVIEGQIIGDARAPGSFRAALTISSPRVDSPWGRGRDVNAKAHLAPSASGAFVADISVEANDAVTPWATANALSLQAHVAPSFTRWTPTNASVTATLKQARTRWGNAGNVTLLARFEPNPSDAAASLAHYTLRAQKVDTRWAKAARLELASDAVLTSSNLWPSTAKARLQFAGGEIEWGRAATGTVEGTLDLPPLTAMEFGNTNLSWWTRLDRVGAGLAVAASDVHTSYGDVKSISLNAAWREPGLLLRDVKAQVFEGTVEGRASLDTRTRLLSASAHTTIDPHKIRPLLDTNTQKWLAHFTWRSPPVINADATVTLPAWTNGMRAFASADWDKVVLPTLSVSGDVAGEESTYRGIPVTSARTTFAFSNMTWRFPDLIVTRPEGRALISHTGHSRNGQFFFDIDSTINPSAVASLLGKTEREVVGWFAFTNQPPHLRAKIAGNWHQPKETSFYAIAAATNFSFRDLPFIEARSVITFTNQVLTCVEPEVVRSEGAGVAASVVIDIPREKIFINHAVGRLAPGAVTHAVGKETEEVMSPYKFINAPYGRANGVIDIDDIRGTDMTFELAGGPFEWKVFRFQQITGRVHWMGSAVALSNISGSLHGGLLEGSARFDFPDKAPSTFSFRTFVNNINLHSLLYDMGNTSNKVEGTLNGLLVVTNGLTEDLKSWDGYGNIAVNDGLLWDFPIFGLFSPILNTIKDGAGNSRAKEAVATFNITNSVINASELAISASGMRLKGEGTVDFERNVNGRMTAQLFRDMPALGPLVSTMLWPVTKLFEYKVTGTLGEPKAAPLYVPKFLSSPFRTLKGIATPDSKNDSGAQ